MFGEGSLTVPQKRAPAELPRLVLVFFFQTCFLVGFLEIVEQYLGDYIDTLFCSIIWGGQILFGGQIYYNMHDPTCCQKPRDFL